MVEKSWLEQEIKNLEALEGQAAKRYEREKYAYEYAEKEMNAAYEELQSLRACKQEWQWQLSNMKGKEAK